MLQQLHDKISALEDHMAACKAHIAALLGINPPAPPADRSDNIADELNKGEAVDNEAAAS